MRTVNIARSAVAAFLALALAPHAMSHAPACDSQIADFESIISEIGDKNQILLDLASVPEGIIAVSNEFMVDRLALLQSLPIVEFRDLIRSVNRLSNCLHDNAHSHE